MQVDSGYVCAGNLLTVSKLWRTKLWKHTIGDTGNPSYLFILHFRRVSCVSRKRQWQFVTEAAEVVAVPFPEALVLLCRQGQDVQWVVMKTSGAWLVRLHLLIVTAAWNNLPQPHQQRNERTCLLLAARVFSLSSAILR